MNKAITRTAIFSLGLMFAGCASAPRPRAILTPKPGHPTYEGAVTIDPGTQHLSATWRIAFVADATTTDSVRLLLNRGLRVSSVAGDRVLDSAIKDTAGHNNVALRLKPGTKVGDVVAFDISYAGTPTFGQDSINGIGRGWVELGLDSFWHPVFAAFNQSIVGSFHLEAPRDWDVVASGEFANGQLTNTTPLIDIAFAAAPRIQKATSERATVYHVNADTAVINRVLTTSASCAAYLNEHYGARGALPHAKMVLAPRNGPGYARKNYIVITETRNLPPEALGRFICHELAHYWSSGAVSSGPENWLNEGLAEFVSARYVRTVHGEAAYQKIVEQWQDAGKGQPAVWTPASTRRPGPRVAYRKAPYIMHQLEQRIGSALMDKVLESYMLNRIATTPELLQMVTTLAGAEQGEWLRTELAREG